MSAALTLLLLASSSMSAGVGGVYACSGGSFDVTKFDLKTCDVSVFKKALKKVSKDLDLPEDTVTTILGDDTPIDWGTASEAEPKAEPEAEPKAEPEAEPKAKPKTEPKAKPGKTQAQIQAEEEAKAKEAERQRLLKMPPDTIDRKPGIVKGFEITSDPSWVNVSPEDCWSIVKDEDEYSGIVGWGHRNEKHPDPKLRNSCFVYIRKEDGTGMPPFNGDPNDKIHVSGCHKPGLKLSDGCMTNDEKEYFARMKRMPPKNIDTVFGQPRGVQIESDPSWVDMSAEECFELASDAGIDGGVRAWGYRTADYKDKKLRNTCFLYRDGDFTEFKGTDDKTIITGCVGPNMKVANGCLTAEEMTQQIQSTSKMQKVLAIAAMAAKVAEKLAKEAVAAVAKAAEVAAAAVKRAAQEAAKQVAKAAKAVVDAAKAAAQKAKQAAEYAARKAKQAAEAVANAAKRVAQEAAQKTVQAAKAAANAAKQAAVATANALKNVALNGARKAVAAAKAAANAAKQAATAVANAAAKAARAAAEAAKRAAEAAKRAAQEAARRVAEAAKRAAAAAKRAAEEAAKRAAEAAKKAAEAAKKAAEEAAKKVANAAKSVAKAAKKAFSWVCFSPHTLITLENGTRVCIKDLKLGDVLMGGTIVDATMQIGNRSKDLYYKIFSKELDDYIYVTGSHYIKHGEKYVKVCDFPGSIQTEEYDEVLYCLVTSTHKIPVGEYTFWDWEDNLVNKKYIQTK